MQLGIYRHFKGHDVTVIGIGKHTETLEDLVVYTHDGKLWVRPKDMFEEYVERDGKTFKRFTFIKELNQSQA